MRQEFECQKRNINTRGKKRVIRVAKLIRGRGERYEVELWDHHERQIKERAT